VLEFELRWACCVSNVGTGGVYSGPARLQRAMGPLFHMLFKRLLPTLTKPSEMMVPLYFHSISPKMSPVCNHSSPRVIKLWQQGYSWKWGWGTVSPQRDATIALTFLTGWSLTQCHVQCNQETVTYFICFTIVLFPDSPAPEKEAQWWDEQPQHLHIISDIFRPLSHGRGIKQAFHWGWT